MAPQPPDGKRIADEVRRLCGAYADLLDGLTAASARMDEDAIAGVEQAIGALAAFVQSDHSANAAGAARPLQALVAAIHDLRRGGKPALFDTPPAQNRPANMAVGALKGQLAAAAVILETAGVMPGDAADKVAAMAARHRLRMPGKGEDIGSKTIREWRNEIRQGSGRVSPLMRDAFFSAVRAEVARQRGEGRLDAGRSEHMATAESRAEGLVRSLLGFFPPTVPAAKGGL